MSVPQNRLVPVEKPGDMSFLKPLGEIIRQAARGEITPKQLTDFAERRNPFGEEKFASLEYATNLLGKTKVVTHAQSWQAWTGEKIQSKNEPRIHYLEKTLSACARTNRNGVSDWRLVFIQHWDLERQVDLIRQPRHRRFNCYDAIDLWSAFAAGRWTLGTRPESPTYGYHLIDFKGRWGKMTHEEQDGRIRSAGSKFLRTHEVTMAQALVSVALVHDQYPFHRTMHWGPTWSLPAGAHVVIGPFDRTGLVIGAGVYGDACNLEVSVTRRFDFESA